jgi:hypothetical protein
MEPKSIETLCSEYREQCKIIEKATRELLDHDRFKGEQAFIGQHGEMKAHCMLAVRHLEDARMRFGKVIQYAGDGISCFDK